MTAERRSRAAKARAVPRWTRDSGTRALRALEAVERRAVVGRYAMLSPESRRPILCVPPLHPTRDDLASRGKIVFPSRQAAEDAAIELHHRCGAQPMRPYPCRRHWHLKTDLERGLR